VARSGGGVWGASTMVRWCGMACTNLEPAGMGGWHTSAQKRGSGGDGQVRPWHSNRRWGLKLI
jgi:hypothetical protein